VFFSLFFIFEKKVITRNLMPPLFEANGKIFHFQVQNRYNSMLCLSLDKWQQALITDIHTHPAQFFETSKEKNQEVGIEQTEQTEQNIPRNHPVKISKKPTYSYFSVLKWTNPDFIRSTGSNFSEPAPSNSAVICLIFAAATLPRSAFSL